MTRVVHSIIASVCLAIFIFTPVVAFGPVAAVAQSKKAATANSGTVGFVTGNYGQLSLRLIAEMAEVLDEGDQLRVLPVIGRGELSNISDMLYLQGMDATIVPADVLDYAVRKNLFPGLKNKLRIVCRLHIQDVHIVARAGVSSLEELRGKTVNVVSKNHGSFVTAQNVFGSFGIDYKPVFLDQRKALQKVVQGEIDATVIVSGRPNLLLQDVQADDRLGFVPVAFSTKLPDVYFPVKLKSKDYPNLVQENAEVPSVATTAIMVVFNFRTNPFRQAKVSRFVDAFLSRFPELQAAPRHPRWRDVNLGSSVRGWERYPPAAKWLKDNQSRIARKPTGKTRSLKALFQDFLDSEARAGRADDLLRLSKAELFKRFVAWRKTEAARLASLKPAANPDRSLKVLFQRFINDEVARVGKANVQTLSKDQLFERFLVWRRTNGQAAAQ